MLAETFIRCLGERPFLNGPADTTAENCRSQTRKYRAQVFSARSIIFNAMDLHFASRQPIFLRMATALPVRESIGAVLGALEIVAGAQN
jgi:hypothetical protein